MSTSCPEDHHQMLSFTTRKKLQGPRPAALKVNKFSSGVNVAKMKKPEMGHQIHSRIVVRSRSPVVIYMVSPKIIHVKPEEFMGLVQRLTGRQALSSSSSSLCREMEKDSKSVINETNNHPDDQTYFFSDAVPRLGCMF